MRHPPSDVLILDGSHGEGGGQILRTALSLAAATGRAVRIERIRAGRRNPGLAAQHLTAVRAAAAICRASVSGDSLGSQTVEFLPARRVHPGEYAFDVAAAREGGSAGATTLVLQTVLLPLALAEGRSHVVVRGGTHMPWSPSFDYLEAVWLPLLRRLGISAEIAAATTGWFPIGKGEIWATIAGLGKDRCGALQPASLVERGALVRILGRAIAANLPSHIPQRMVDRARSLLQPLGVELRLVAERVQAACPGAGLFLTAEFENVRGGVGAQGERGKSSEAVAEEAVTSLVAYLDSRAAVDAHLADQILAPLALAGGPSTFSAERCTRHLETNAWVIDRFGLAAITIEKRTDGTARVDVRPTGSHRGDPEH